MKMSRSHFSDCSIETFVIFFVGYQKRLPFFNKKVNKKGKRGKIKYRNVKKRKDFIYYNTINTLADIRERVPI